MRRKGTHVRCDRCGKNKLYSAGTDEDIIKQIAGDGWRSRNGKDLCAECAAQYDGMIEKFFDEVWDK